MPGTPDGSDTGWLKVCGDHFDFANEHAGHHHHHGEDHSAHEQANELCSFAVAFLNIALAEADNGFVFQSLLSTPVNNYQQAVLPFRHRSSNKPRAPPRSSLF